MVILSFSVLSIQDPHFGSPVRVVNVNVLLYCLVFLTNYLVYIFSILKTLSMIPGMGALNVGFCDDDDS